MVGTTPTSSPACRHASACSCMAIADSTTIDLPGGVLVLRGGEGAAPDVLVELAGGGFDRLSEFGGLAEGHPAHGPSQSRGIPGVEHLRAPTAGAGAAEWGGRHRLRGTLAHRDGGH